MIEMFPALNKSDVDRNPIKQFAKWYGEATASGIPETDAMTLATATKDGRPSARIVLLKDFDDRGFVFFTNYESRKGKEVVESREVLEQRYAALSERYGEEVPRPPHWGGYRIQPEVIEFWQGRDNRLHDRLRFRLQKDGTWLIERLGP